MRGMICFLLSALCLSGCIYVPKKKAPRDGVPAAASAPRSKTDLRREVLSTRPEDRSGTDRKYAPQKGKDVFPELFRSKKEKPKTEIQSELSERERELFEEQKRETDREREASDDILRRGEEQHNRNKKSVWGGSLKDFLNL